MDVVLKKILYNSEVFSKIVEDFEAFRAGTKPEVFSEVIFQTSSEIFCVYVHLTTAIYIIVIFTPVQY